MRRLLALGGLLPALLLVCGFALRDGAAMRDLEAITPDRLARYVIEEGCGRDPDALEHLNETQDEETLAYYLTEIYGLEANSWTDVSVYRAGGTEAFEIAVVRTESEKAAKKVAKALEDYIEVRAGDFEGYEPEQADIVSRSAAAYSRFGDAALLICEDAKAAEQAFEDGYGALYRVPFDPPLKDDMTLYDDGPVLAAWESGDDSALDETDRAILELASQVLDEETDPDMTPYERERALYAWLTANAVYDQDHYDPLAKMAPGSYTPYGPLHDGKAICVGFATCFQLLMDMADVECVTVVGASRANASDHAWNMVRLDGKWYCADATWDVGDEQAEWQYFNVTSDWMAQSNHQWDYAAVPEATATDGGVGAD